MTDTKTAVERARDLAVPIMTEARRLRESNDLQWASWHAAIVEGIQQAITDTETQHVAAAVQKAREEWDREEQHGCCENLKKKIVEIANLKAQLAEANRNLGMLANCSIAIVVVSRERNAEIANLKARYDKALAGWQAERSDWQNDVKKLESQAERQLTGDDIQASAPVLTHQDASYYDRKAEELKARLVSKTQRVNPQGQRS